MAEVRVPALENDLQNDEELRKQLQADPKPILKNYGVEIDDDAADRIKNLLKDQIDRNSPITPALYVAIKV